MFEDISHIISLFKPRRIEGRPGYKYKSIIEEGYLYMPYIAITEDVNIIDDPGHNHNSQFYTKKVLNTQYYTICK